MEDERIMMVSSPLTVIKMIKSKVDAIKLKKEYKVSKVRKSN